MEGWRQQNNSEEQQRWGKSPHHLYYMETEFQLEYSELEPPDWIFRSQKNTQDLTETLLSWGAKEQSSGQGGYEGWEAERAARSLSPSAGPSLEAAHAKQDCNALLKSSSPGVNNLTYTEGKAVLGPQGSGSAGSYEIALNVLYFLISWAVQ